MHTVSQLSAGQSSERALCVDLDGTLIASDLLWECLVSAVRHRPWSLLGLPLWLLRGRAHLKRQIATASQLDVESLPYRPAVLAFLRDEYRRGRNIVLATAADETLAAAVSQYLGIFKAVLASDGVTNLKGATKARALVHRFGAANFDYVGDSPADIPVWTAAAMSFAVGRARINGVPELQTIGPRDQQQVSGVARLLVKALRPHQWLKNLLLLIPALAAHRFDGPTFLAVAIGFMSLSVCASGGYVLNDLLDVGADRRHARKRHRPFASGRLSIRSGIAMLAALWAVGFALAAIWLPTEFALVLVGYIVTTAAYSIRLKREAVLDVMVLAGLYVVRVVAGGVATGIPVSTWLLAFTLFISLSLAFLKRFIEVTGHTGPATTSVPGRGYMSDDGAWLHAVGLASGYLGALVLALYANNIDVTRLYSHPERLLLVCPMLLYWTTRLWFKAHRRDLHDDPVVVVALDPVTYVVVAISAASVYAAV
jgi:4-hydroxybenzoate polyprenyltransferase